MSAPRISIVLPCYNAAAYLQDTLDSLSAQTYTDFECIAINDGSTDATLSILTAHAEQDPRFILISRENRGLIATLNEGVQHAQGEWIARMDADDIAHADRLEKQLAHLQSSNTDICGTWIRFFGDRQGEWRLPTTSAAILAHLLFNVALAHPTIMARACLLKAHPYDPATPCAEDYALWCELAMTGARFSNVGEILLDYRTHPGQISQSRIDTQRATAQAIRARYIPWYLPEELQEFAPLLITLADSSQTLSEADFCALAALMLRLNALRPACAEAFGPIWLDALQRTPDASARLAWMSRRLARAFPLPKGEGRRYMRILLRCMLGRPLRRWLKGA